jgi:hypothetical protein
MAMFENISNVNAENSNFYEIHGDQVNQIIIHAPDLQPAWRSFRSLWTSVQQVERLISTSSHIYGSHFPGDRRQITARGSGAICRRVFTRVGQKISG